MNIQNLKTRISFIIACTALAACSKSNHSTSNLTDITMRHADGRTSVVYAEQDVVYLRRCATNTDLIDRTCPTTSDLRPASLSMKTYTAKLAVGFAVDEDIIQLGTVARFDKLRDETRALIASGKLKPDELAKAKEFLQRLDGNAERITTYLDILTNLASGQDLVLNQRFSNDFQLILAPFAAVEAPASSTWIKDPNTGLVWAKIADMCWYDAADVSRDGNICFTFFAIPGQFRPEVYSGCKRTLGLKWTLPTERQLFSTIQGPKGPLESWSITGKYFSEVKYFNHWEVHDGRPKTSDETTHCVAKASEVDPEGDVDSDGVTNQDDQCNRLPHDRTTQVDLSGPRRGCAAGQKTDFEIGDTLVDPREETATSPMVPYNPQHAYRYSQRTSPAVDCTKTDGTQGKRYYVGMWDPEAVNGSSKGQWVAPPHSGWSECK